MVVIEAVGLSKCFGSKVAVDGVSFGVRPGVVTGFLGPNGAGKSTTMRMIVGLDRPSSGSVTVNGRSFVLSRSPLREVGALLDAKAAHPGRSAVNHLRAVAATGGIGRARVREVIEMTGLGSVAKKRVKGFSLGMGQRLGIATALLGDPGTLILDEPVNGLDPEGVLWVRELLRSLAGEGRTVMLSSHLMSEMQQTADHLIVIGRGRVLADAPMKEIVARASRDAVRVRSPQAVEFSRTLAGPGVTVSSTDATSLEVVGLSVEKIAAAAAQAGVVLHELTPVAASLEDAYFELTNDEVEYRSSSASDGVKGSVASSTKAGAR